MQKIFIFIFCLFPLSISAQHSIVVDLKTTDSLAFRGSRVITWLAPDSVGLYHVPADIESYKIKEHSFSPELPPLRIFYGITGAGKRQVIFDTDFDGDLKGEYVYTFDGDIKSNQKQREDSTMRAIPAVKIRYPGMKQEILLKPVIFNRVANYNTVQDSIWHLFVESNYDRTAKLTVLGKSYQLFAQGQVAEPRYNSLFEFFIVPEHDQSLISNNDNNPPYKLREKIAVDGIQFVIDSVSPYLERAWISYRGITDTVYGVREGEYAENITGSTIEDTPIDLQALRGQYVLIDFWGSWCNPCIELIPEIRELHATYKDKGLVILSIGVDTRDNFGKMREIIKREQMDWLHVFSAFGDPAALNVRYNVSCFPTSIILDKQGKIVYRGCGLQDFPHVKQKLEELLVTKLIRTP